MFAKILVPVDQSELAEQAVGPAAAIARASGARLELLLVHQPLAFAGFDDAPWNPEVWEEGQTYLASLVDEISSGAAVSVAAAMLKGDPVDVICEHVREESTDLVVMTSHGRTGLRRAWMGSVANGVLRHSTAPVLMLRPVEGKRSRDAAHHIFKHILVPVDGSPASAEIVEPAVALAKCADATITLLRVVQPLPIVAAEPGFAYIPPLVDEMATRRLVDAANDELADLAARLRNGSAGSIAAKVVVSPIAASAILEHARESDADLIAMSTHGRGMSRFLLGSVTESVLRNCALAMLVLRPRAHAVVAGSASAGEGRSPVRHSPSPASGSPR